MAPRDRVVLAALIVVSAAFRLPSLTLNSLWLDELYTLYTIGGDLGAFWGRTTQDIHPPLGSFVFWLATRLFGATDLVVRGVAAGFGILGPALLYGLFHRWVGRVPALTAAAAWVMAPFSIYYAQEARVYTMAFCWSCVLLWRTLYLVERPTRRNALLLGVVTAVAMYLHYAFAALILALYPAALLWANTDLRQRFVRLGQAAATATIVYLPWAFAMLQDAFGHTTWVQPPGPAKLRQVLMKMLSGESGLVMLFALGVTLFLVRLSQTRDAASVRTRSVLLTASIVPLAVAFTKSLIPDSPALLNPQLMMLLAPPLLLAWGIGVGALRGGVGGRKLAAVFVATWCLLAVGVLMRNRFYTEPTKADNRGAVAHIVERIAATSETPVVLYSDDKPDFIAHYLQPHGLEAAFVLTKARHLSRVDALLRQIAQTHEPRRVFLIEAHRDVDDVLLARLAAASRATRTHALVRATVHEFLVIPGRARKEIGDPGAS